MYFYSSGSLSRDCLIVKPIFTVHIIREVDRWLEEIRLRSLQGIPFRVLKRIPTKYRKVHYRRTYRHYV